MSESECRGHMKVLMGKKIPIPLRVCAAHFRLRLEACVEGRQFDEVCAMAQMWGEPAATYDPSRPRLLDLVLGCETEDDQHEASEKFLLGLYGDSFMLLLQNNEIDAVFTLAKTYLARFFTAEAGDQIDYTKLPEWAAGPFDTSMTVFKALVAICCPTPGFLKSSLEDVTTLFSDTPPTNDHGVCSSVVLAINGSQVFCRMKDSYFATAQHSEEISDNVQEALATLVDINARSDDGDLTSEPFTRAVLNMQSWAKVLQDGAMKPLEEELVCLLKRFEPKVAGLPKAQLQTLERVCSLCDPEGNAQVHALGEKVRTSLKKMTEVHAETALAHQAAGASPLVFVVVNMALCTWSTDVIVQRLFRAGPVSPPTPDLRQANSSLSRNLAFVREGSKKFGLSSPTFCFSCRCLSGR